MKSLQRLVREARKLVRTSDGRIWEIRRVNAAELAPHGVVLELATVEAAKALHDALQESEAADARNADVEAGMAAQLESLSDEERKAVEAQKAAQEAHLVMQKQRLFIDSVEKMVKRHPDRIQSAAKAQAAYVCAGVFGILDPDEYDDVQIDADAELFFTQEDAEAAAARNKARWEAECEAVGHEVPRYPRCVAIRPEAFRFVLEERQEDTRATPHPRLWVYKLPEAIIGELAVAVRELSATPAEVLKPFRSGPTAVPNSGLAEPSVSGAA